MGSNPIGVTSLTITNPREPSQACVFEGFSCLDGLNRCPVATQVRILISRELASSHLSKDGLGQTVSVELHLVEVCSASLLALKTIRGLL